MIVEYIAGRIDDLFVHPFNEEIKGIAEVLNMPVGGNYMFLKYLLSKNEKHKLVSLLIYYLKDVVIANLIYDFSA